jgi:3-oxoacyl-(acyl-carrier-protein) synthase
MTAPNPSAVQECIIMALKDAGINATQIDVIHGHLTATAMDALEVQNWSLALKRDKSVFPLLLSLKSLIGHTIAAAGAIETVASLVGLEKQFVFGNVNVDIIHPDVLKWIGRDQVPRESLSFPHQIVVKANFGFGDVNACIVIKKY